MSSPAEMAERHGRMLAELGELGLGLARELQGRALIAETPAEAAQLAEAFHRIARSVRQSLALEAKLQRDGVREAREARERAARDTEARRAARKAQLKKYVERLIWDEVEPDIAREMIGEAPHLVEREAECERFLDEPVEAQIARLRDVLGLDDDWAFDEAPQEAEGPQPAAPEAAAGGAEPPPEPPPEPPARKPPPARSPYEYWYNSA